MTPANPDALAFRDDLVRAISNGSFGKHYEAANAFMASHVAPLLADLQRVTAERDAAREESYDLKLAAAGGEDVPGSANLVTAEDVRRWRDEETRALRAAEARAAQLQAEVEALKGSVSSYSAALAAMKLGAACRRQAWKPGKTVRIVAPQAPALSYLALVYDDGRQAPWTPTRCDQLEDDWLIAQPEREAVDV
ncbi:Thoeris anti-defense Tad2 family protein [Methylorubrum sp. SL192]|uniref:Thoeris anti-defense Tad2 family protein n=1 Tax=Methylorubrum sp. SL192 TaxID=2995167 RepID=UPI002276737C|nr:MW1434 family type I TA system toxin [Methylorubrum sp. SL192]MCY1644773.1 DUF2829 domain-containing protein [Methylorubrum sp. SL192]